MGATEWHSGGEPTIRGWRKLPFGCRELPPFGAGSCQEGSKERRVEKWTPCLCRREARGAALGPNPEVASQLFGPGQVFGTGEAGGGGGTLARSDSCAQRLLGAATWAQQLLGATAPGAQKRLGPTIRGQLFGTKANYSGRARANYSVRAKYSEGERAEVVGGRAQRLLRDSWAQKRLGRAIRAGGSWPALSDFPTQKSSFS